MSRHEIYFSRKRQYSIKLQAVCDHNLKIRHATVGHPGSVHDAKVFSQCPLKQRPQHYFSGIQWIAGDSAYPLSQNLITPYRRNTAELPREETEKFNRYFSSYRVRIENCFGALKERFGSLKELRQRLKSEQNHKECCQWIMVCCILHNALLEYNSPTLLNSNNHGNNLVNYPREIVQHTNLRTALYNYIKNKTN